MLRLLPDMKPADHTFANRRRAGINLAFGIVGEANKVREAAQPLVWFTWLPPRALRALLVYQMEFN